MEHLRRALAIANEVEADCAARLPAHEGLGDVYGLVGAYASSVEQYAAALACAKGPRQRAALWLRLTAGQKLVELHRHHLGTRMRAAGREVSLNRSNLPEASSAVLAARLLGHDPRPSVTRVPARRDNACSL